MAPDYDDDDIVEDYEEVTTDSPVRRVSSAQGGPVQRPGDGGARPSTTSLPTLTDDEYAAAAKGKITQKSAKMIWVICILVSLLGVAAVLVDLLVDPLERHKKAPATANTGGADGAGSQIPPRKRPDEASPHQKNAAAFARGANEHFTRTIGSRAFDFVCLATKELEEKFAAADKERSNDALWVEAWVAYYNAEYAVELFYHATKVDLRTAKFKPIPDFRDPEQCEFLDDSELLDPEAQRIQGIVQAVAPETAKISKYSKPLNGVSAASNVRDKEEINGPINEAKAKLTAAREKKEFAQEDLDYVNREPRGPDESPPYMD